MPITRPGWAKGELNVLSKCERVNKISDTQFTQKKSGNHSKRVKLVHQRVKSITPTQKCVVPNSTLSGVKILLFYSKSVFTLESVFHSWKWFSLLKVIFILQSDFLYKVIFILESGFHSWRWFLPMKSDFHCWKWFFTLGSDFSLLKVIFTIESDFHFS